MGLFKAGVLEFVMLGLSFRTLKTPQLRVRWNPEDSFEVGHVLITEAISIYPETSMPTGDESADYLASPPSSVWKWGGQGTGKGRHREWAKEQDQNSSLMTLSQVVL